MRKTLFLVSLVSLAALPFRARAADKIDFEKQVQPLLEQKCHSCHGPDVQQSGLRLDKRQNAMRGGDYGPVIIPGKSSESKLIRRVVNGDGGMQMPPTGPLSSEEIAILRAWIDQGAEFITDVTKEEAPPKPIDPRLAAIINAVRSDRTAEVKRLIAANPGLINAADQAGSTPLHHAAAFASLNTMKVLLDAGANVNAKNRRASTPLHWAIRDEAKVRLLLDHGAGINTKQADGRTPLYQAASLGNGDSILRLLLDKGADPNLATSNGQTPLMAASGRGNIESMRLLIAKKATVDAKNGAGATALITAAGSRDPRAVKLLLDKGASATVFTKRHESALANAATAGDEESVRLLLAKGADVNTPDDRGYSPLMYAAASESMNVAVVKALLAKGANPDVTGEEETPRTLAAKRGDTEVARLLGVPAEDLKRQGIAPLPAVATERPVSEAVQKGLALLEKQSHNFIRTAGCNSCHSQDLPSAAAALARDHGIAAPREIPQLSESLNGESPDRIMDLGAVSVNSISWEMFDRGMNRVAKDQYSDATVYFIKASQTPEGYWKGADGRRPPMNSGDLQSTALAIYTLRNFSPAAEQAETDQAIARAEAWLETIHPENTQQRAFHLLGLAWANAAPAVIEHAAKALAASQRADGGWNQLSGMGSDAYASGEALYALNVAGKMPVDNAVYQKGVHYLLRAQANDGSWHVKTRSIWVQPYFDSGFPYVHDQWISAAGTAWASMALSLTVETPKITQK
jgi:ankyrin repeat protein/mono/diheme cytochrome c family protein